VARLPREGADPAARWGAPRQGGAARPAPDICETLAHSRACNSRRPQAAAAAVAPGWGVARGSRAARVRGPDPRARLGRRTGQVRAAVVGAW